MPMSYGFLSTYTPTESGLATFGISDATIGIAIVHLGELLERLRVELTGANSRFRP